MHRAVYSFNGELSWGVHQGGFFYTPRRVGVAVVQNHNEWLGQRVTIRSMTTDVASGVNVNSGKVVFTTLMV